LRQKLYRGEKPVLTLLYGASGIAEKDVARALDNAAAFFELVYQPVVPTNTSKVREAISQAKGDVIALFRGGGDLSSLDNLELARTLLESPLAVVVALGHEADETLLDKVADKILSTPTALGTYLRDLVQETQTLDARSREKVRGELEKEFNERWQREKELLEAKRRSRGSPAWALVIAVIFSLLVGIVLGRFW
jgi:exodeoxyribonuclease VII large subunit